MAGLFIKYSGNVAVELRRRRRRIPWRVEGRGGRGEQECSHGRVIAVCTNIDIQTYLSQIWTHLYNYGHTSITWEWVYWCIVLGLVCTLQPMAPGSMNRFYWQPLWCPVLHYSYGAPRCCGVWGSDVNYSNSTADVLAPHNSTTPPPH